MVEDAERVVAPEAVSIAEEDTERGAEIVRGARRLRVPDTVCVTEGRRVTLPQEVDDAERVMGPVREPEAVPVSVADPFDVLVILRESGAVGVSARQRVGLGEELCVFDCAELRVPLTLVFMERERAGERVAVLDGATLRVKVLDAVGVLDPAPLRVPVEDTVDVFD